jgi:hypothetical protein
VKDFELVAVAVSDDKSPKFLIAKQVGARQFKQQRYKPRLGKLQMG